MVSLRTQTIKIIGISLVTVAIAGAVWVFLESRVQQEQRLFLEGSELAISAPNQARLLVPGLLVSEEFGSVKLHLGDIKNLEKLSRSEILTEESSFAHLHTSFKCRSLENKTLICVDRSKRKVTTVTPVLDVDKNLGFLVKEKQLSAQELPTTLFFSVIALIAWFSSAFLVIAIWISLFLKRDVRQPLLNLKDILIPVLQNKKGVRFPQFRVAEVQALATQMGQLVKEFEERRVNSTIAETARSLAHDLRRPMVIIKTGLEMIERTSDPEQVKRLASSLQADVDQTISEADDIVATTMEFGERALIQTPTSPEFLIGTTLNNIFRLYPTADIPISYTLTHTHDVNVDVSMALRVFANIVSNAVEAMRGKGEIWFRTNDVASNPTRLVECCIGNSNSSIAEEEIPRIFDAFFTKGKLNGRGLGLAIAQKVVTDHGGKIWCASLPKKGVEFHFTLPISSEPSPKSSIKLPSHSYQVSSAFGGEVEEKGIAALHKAKESDNRSVIIDFAKTFGGKIIIHLIDNEPLYFHVFSSLLKADPELASRIEFCTSETDKSAFQTALVKAPLLIICDYDMGKHSLNGLEIVSELRNKGVGTFICIHSALKFSKNEVRAAGGDYFLPKPMDAANFLTLLVMAMKHYRAGMSAPIKKESQP